VHGDDGELAGARREFAAIRAEDPMPAAEAAPLR
jgi:hypothetical protein